MRKVIHRSRLLEVSVARGQILILHKRTGETVVVSGRGGLHLTPFLGMEIKASRDGRSARVRVSKEGHAMIQEAREKRQQV